MFGNKIEKTILIEGMHCGGCSKRVEETLKSINGVKTVTISLENKAAQIVLRKDIDNEILKCAIEEIGFKVVDIRLDK